MAKRISPNIPTIEVGRPLQPTRYVFPIKPLALDRPRYGGNMHDTAKNRAYKDALAEYAALVHPFGEPFVGDLRVMINFYVSSRVHGDIDNLIKGILDGVQSRRKQVKGKWVRSPGVVMNDDKQVKALSASFVYIPKGEGERERTEMIVDRYNAEDITDAGILAESSDSADFDGDLGDVDGALY